MQAVLADAAEMEGALNRAHAELVQRVQREHIEHKASGMGGRGWWG